LKTKTAISLSLLLYSLLLSGGVAAQSTVTTGGAEGSTVAKVSGTVYSNSNRLAGIEVSVSSEVSSGVVTTLSNENGEYSVDVPYVLSADGSANLKFRATDPDGEYKTMEFGAILYPDKTDGYDFHMSQ